MRKGEKRNRINQFDVNIECGSLTLCTPKWATKSREEQVNLAREERTKWGRKK